jgi:hypothetical protein
MVDTNIPHDTEARLRNIEAHMGIGVIDEETGEYSVKQYEEPAEPGRPHEEEHEDE